MHSNTEFVTNWIDRMAQRFGSTVYDSITRKNLDWGQALCRLRYGENWMTDLPDDPDTEAVILAQKWEAGELSPDWASYPNKPKKEHP